MPASARRHLLIAAALFACAAPCAWAQSQGRERGPERGPERGQQRDQDSTLSDSVRRIERDTRGQVLSAERIPFEGRNVNRVKVMDSRGRVRVYMDDPHRRGVERVDRDQRDRPTRDDDD